MKLEINDTSLHNYLYGKKDYIGYSFGAGIVNVVGGFSFAITIFSSPIKNKLLLIFLYALSGLLLVIGAIQIIRRIFSENYDYLKLYNEIKHLSVSESRYSLVAILNTFEGDSSNKVLLHYKKDWDTFMFLSFRTALENDEENIANRVAASLKVKRDKIRVKFLTEKPCQPKYSPQYKAERLYDNRYYQVYINHFPDTLRQLSFTIDHAKYKWMTLEEMQNDKKISQNNTDIVSVFEQYIFSTSPIIQPITSGMDMPENVCIRLNRHCNLSCEFCLANRESDGLSTSQIKSMLKTLRKSGIKKARLAGGEPTLRPDFIEIVKYCVDLGLDVIVYTNLIDVDCIINKLKNYPVSVTTSIHGDAAVHDSITQPGAYQRTYSNIRKLISYNIPVTIHMVLMEKNYKYAESVIQDAINAGVRKVSIQTLIPRGRGKDLFNTDEDMSLIREKLKTLYPLREKYRNQIIVNFIDLYEKEYYVLETDGAIYLEKAEASRDVFIRSLL